MKKYRYVYIEITNACNLHCPFCPTSKKRQNDYMSLDEFKSIITSIKPYTNTVYFHVKGEPLLHPLLGEFINICQDMNINVNITTNGVLIPKWTEQLLTSKNINKINISLQCLIDFTDLKREKYLDNLIIFLNKKIDINPELGINLRIWNNKQDIRTQILNEIIRFRLGSFIDHKIKNIHLSEAEEFLWPSLNHSDNLVQTKCLGGINQLAILCNGDVTICCLDEEGCNKIGNIHKMTMNDILSSPNYLETISYYQKGKVFYPLCQKCTYRNRFIKKEDLNYEIKN